MELTWLEIHINKGRFVSIEATRDKAIVCVCVCVCNRQRLSKQSKYL